MIGSWPYHVFDEGGDIASTGSNDQNRMIDASSDLAISNSIETYTILLFLCAEFFALRNKENV